ncbi:L,D-transpeptidase [Stenomitos frigidus]|nr:L,D-transpeptidase [Stenomitos frigidus]
MAALDSGQDIVSQFPDCAIRSLVLGLSLLTLLLGSSQPATGQEAASESQSSPFMLTILPPLPTFEHAITPENAAIAVRLVVKLSQRRVYLYQGDRLLAKYTLAIGKQGWETPTGIFQVLSKEKNPVFKSFRTGQLIEPGPDNPLGVRWIGIWTDGKTQIGFHGTNQEELLGQAVSHGCLRMRNRDVTAMFDQVSLGTIVSVEP